MRAWLLPLIFFIAASLPATALVLAEGKQATAPFLPDTAAIVRVHTPFGVTASGILLAGGTHVLTAGHVASCVSPAQVTKGIFVFANLPDSPRRSWKRVQLHPRATTAALAQVWDVALIELDSPIPATLHPGLSITPIPLAADQLVALTGYGRRGNGLLGDYQSEGPFNLGFNYCDLPITPELCRLLRLPNGKWPLLVHQFDAPSSHQKNKVIEAHFATGDSGGGGLIIGEDNRTYLATLNIARHRGSSDSDHRLNGSYGELGISLDAHALLPWLSEHLPHLTPQPTRK